MQILARNETQPHALGQQAALDWLAAPASARRPVCPFAYGSPQWHEWQECFYREHSDHLAAAYLL